MSWSHHRFLNDADAVTDLVAYKRTVDGVPQCVSHRGILENIAAQIHVDMIVDVSSLAQDLNPGDGLYAIEVCSAERIPKVDFVRRQLR